MKLQKSLLNLATLTLVGFVTVACNSSSGPTSDRYAEGLQAGKQQGYAEGYDVGYDDGYADGDEAGYERAKQYFASSDYSKGFAEGNAVGYNTGFSAGKVAGKTEGYDMGYDDGYLDGQDSVGGSYETAYNAGYDDGQLDGYDMGYDDGQLDGYDLGYDDGMADGYDFGYDDGYYDGTYGLSIGKTKQLKGYANVLSMFHNDLIDYKKIATPKATKRGLVVNGKLLLSETSVTNKDTLKRAAAVEQYLVVEMAKQVKGKFGLSAERSLKVAKAANHFRKYSSKRALTAEDTNAYATEIIGADFGTITKAYESSMRGDLSSFNEVMEKAAEKNETSPEKMAEIMTKLFI